MAILTLCVSLAACAGYGAWVLRMLGLGRNPEPLRWLYAIALGMGTLAYLVLAAGLLGLLQVWVLGALVAVGLALLLSGQWSVVSGRTKTPTHPGTPAPPHPHTSESQIERYAFLLIASLVGVLALTTLLAALKLPDGLDWDGLSYHLAAPKIYLRAGRIFRIDYDSHTDFPATMEMLYTLGMGFAGASGGKLFHWAAGWLTAVAVGAWTMQFAVQGRAVPRWVGPVATAAFAFMPVVLWEMGTAYIDLGTALFQFLAFTALVDGVAIGQGLGVRGKRLEERRSEEGGSVFQPSTLNPQLSTGVRSALLSGVLTGFALGTKYTALLQFGLLGLGLLYLLARSASCERKAALQAVIGFGAASLLVAAPWYLKNWIWVQNPVYPFAYSVFPHSFSWTPAAARAYSGEQHSFGLRYEAAPALGKALELWNAPWNLAMHGRAFYINLRTLVGDRIGSLGALWVGLLPLLFWCPKLPSRSRWCLAYAGASLLMWLFLSQQVRYLVPVFSVLAVVVALLPALLPSRLLRVAAGIFLGVALALNVWMHSDVARPAIALAAGDFTEPEYLDAQLGGLYQAAGYVNSLSPNARVGLYQETRGFYFDRDYVWANPLQNHLIPYESLKSGVELTEALRKLGITHVLINYDFCEGVQADRWYQLLMDAMQKRRLEEVFRSRGAIPERRGVMVYAIQ